MSRSGNKTSRNSQKRIGRRNAKRYPPPNESSSNREPIKPKGWGYETGMYSVNLDKGLEEGYPQIPLDDQDDRVEADTTWRY